MNITVYSKPFCGGCDKVKELLRDKGIKFQVKDIAADPSAKAEVVEMGFMSVPVTVIENRGIIFKINGFDPEEIETAIKK